LYRDGVIPYVVVPERERPTYQALHPYADVIGIPQNGIGLTRQWILKWARRNKFERVWLLDDDLDDPRTRAHYKAPYVFCPWNEWLAAVEDLTAHPAYGLAGGMNRQWGWMEEAALQNKRVGYAVCLRTAGPWNYWPFLHEDTDMSLQVLEAGYRTIKLPQYVYHTETMDKRPGGCDADYQRGAGVLAGPVLVDKWNRVRPGLVRLDTNKQGKVVTKVRWPWYKATEPLV
jgi:hypothetical protein